jgi:predicted membrane protein
VAIIYITQCAEYIIIHNIIQICTLFDLYIINVQKILQTLMAVVFTMSKYMVATTIPMMGENTDDFNQGKSHHDHELSNTSDWDCISWQGEQQQIQPVNMSKYVVVTTLPMVGGHEDNHNQSKSHRDQEVSNTSN